MHAPLLVGASAFNIHNTWRTRTVKKIKDIVTVRNENMGVTIARFIFENGWTLSCRLDRWSTEVAVFNPEDAWMSATVFEEVFGRNYEGMGSKECVVEKVTPEQLEQLANYIADIKEN